MGLAGIGQKVAPLDPADSLKQLAEVMKERRQRAALYVEHAAQLRTPVEQGKHPRRQPGTLRGAVHAEVTATGIVIRADQFFAYFVEKGHKIGPRRARRARLLRATAKELRRIRKDTGDETLKEKEDEFRREATRINKENVHSRRSVAANPFLERTVNEELPKIIEILAGNA